MEVKTIYLDLQEWVKKGNVWRLESEAFKDPLKVEICYDDNDKKFYNEKIEEVRKIMETHNQLFDKLENQITEQQETLKAYEDMLTRYETVIAWYEKQIQEKDKDIQSLLKLIADLKMVQDTHSWAIIQLQDATKQISQKITKQPIVIHDKWFISGNEPAGLWMINLPDWDYLLNAKYTVWEHNEYVTNKDDLVFDKIHVEWQHYIPFYKLEWGTELDTPTATIYYDLIFMPL